MLGQCIDRFQTNQAQVTLAHHTHTHPSAVSQQVRYTTLAPSHDAVPSSLFHQSLLLAPPSASLFRSRRLLQGPLRLKGDTLIKIIFDSNPVSFPDTQAQKTSFRPPENQSHVKCGHIQQRSAALFRRSRSSRSRRFENWVKNVVKPQSMLK